MMRDAREIDRVITLEAQTGVRYETLRRHYGKWVRTEGDDQLETMARLAPSFGKSLKMLILQKKRSAKGGT